MQIDSPIIIDIQFVFPDLHTGSEDDHVIPLADLQGMTGSLIHSTCIYPHIVCQTFRRVCVHYQQYTQS